MATRVIPNPQKYEKGSFETLKESQVTSKEIEKWQKNTDINTFRSAIEGEKTFAEVEKSFKSVIHGQTTSLKLQKEDIDEKDKGQKSFSKDLSEGLGRAFKPLFKPLGKLFENLKGEEFVNFGDLFSEGSERFNSGMKELTNGIGMLGPVINSVKTSFNKFIAVLNILWGGLQLIIGAIGRAWTAAKTFWTGEEPEERKRGSAKSIEEEIANVEQEAKDAGFDISKNDGEEGSSGSISGEVSLTPETLKDIENIVRPYPTEKRGHGIDQDSKPGKSGLILPPNLQREEEEALADKTDSEESFIKRRKDLEDKLHAFKMANEKKHFLWRMMIAMATWILPIAAIIGGFLLLKSKMEDWTDAPFAGIATAGNIVADKTKEVFKGLKNKTTTIFQSMGRGLAKIPGIGKWFKGADVVDDVAKGGAKVAGAADDVVKAGARTAFKTMGKQAFKRIPIAGAVVETGIDAYQEGKKFDAIRNAYETGAKIVPILDEEGKPTGEKRVMTDEEFEEVVKANKANVAGSAGRGAGALAGAAAGAAFGSIIPGVGTVIGGVVGGILGGFFGGRGGDAIATNLAAKAQGIESPQELIDMYAANLPELTTGTGTDMAALDTDIADATSSAGDGGGGNNAVAISDNHSIQTENNYTGPEPVDDSQLGYSLPAGAT